jgi:hypothetical protein
VGPQDRLSQDRSAAGQAGVGGASAVQTGMGGPAGSSAGPVGTMCPAVRGSWMEMSERKLESEGARAVGTTLTPEFWRMVTILLLAAAAVVFMLAAAVDAAVVRIQRRRAARRCQAAAPSAPRHHHAVLHG